jgi:hypothetical protein
MSVHSLTSDSLTRSDVIVVVIVIVLVLLSCNSRHLMDSSELDNYPSSFSDDTLRSGGIILHIIGVCYTFFALAIVCDEYFGK